jgi:outer membrane receptor protein involved in Fe transport
MCPWRPRKKIPASPGATALSGKVYRGEKGEASLFYNYNETFIPVFTLDTRLETFGQRFPNRIADTREAGIKLDLLKTTVVATASVFENTESNVLVRYNDEDGSVTGVPSQAYSIPSGSRTVKGWEVDLNVAPWPGLEFILGYSEMEARFSDGNITPDSLPENTLSLVGRYEVQNGLFKDASAMWLYSYWGDSRFNTRTNWYMPDGDMHTAVLGYRWKNWNARLRIENVFDQIEAQPGAFETAVGLIKPRNYRLALTWTY